MAELADPTVVTFYSGLSNGPRVVAWDADDASGKYIGLGLVADVQLHRMAEGSAGRADPFRPVCPRPTAAPEA